MSLPNEPIEVIDSQLELVLEPNRRLRIFYNPKTGRELTIDSAYFDLLDDPKVYKFYSNEPMSILWIMYSNEIVGVIAPVRLKKELSHVKFKAEEAEQD